MKILKIGLKYGKYLYKLKSVWAKVGLGPLRVSNAIFPYLMLFSAIYFSVGEKTLGSILWAQTPSNWPHHGCRFCQAWPKEYFGLCGRCILSLILELSYSEGVQQFLGLMNQPPTTLITLTPSTFYKKHLIRNIVEVLLELRSVD